MPVFRNKEHWAKKPYHPVIDMIEEGDVISWKGRVAMRTVRGVRRNPDTDHVHTVELVKLCSSWTKNPLTIVDRSVLIRKVDRIIRKGVSLKKTALETRLTTCIIEDRRYVKARREGGYKLPPRNLAMCINESETLGLLY